MVDFYHKFSDDPANLQPDTSAKPDVNNDLQGKSYQQNKPDITYHSDLSNEAWKQEAAEAQHKPWNATVKGRGMIRLASRGILGATAFTLGGKYAKETLAHYNPAAEFTLFTHPTRSIAKAIDTVIGKPLENLVNAMGHDGKAFVTFRPTKYHYAKFGPSVGQHGVTLGHEVVQMTADFAAASVGDAIGRDIALALDPNVKQNWMDEKGHLKYDQIAKNIGYNTFKYLTYNQGEDWAVAVPYVFFTRAQRNLIDKISPGFGYDADRRLNGGSYKVNKDGKVIGTFGLEGALDLQSRFTAYNVGTLMFREAYSEAAHRLHNWHQNGYKLPSLSDPVAAISHLPGSIGKTLRWAARDTVKGILYMTPSVPAFWMFRTPQTKYRGSFINAEEGMITYQKSMGNIQAVHPNEIVRTTNKLSLPHEQFSGHTPTFFSKFDNGNWHTGPQVTNPLREYSTAVNPFANNKFPTYSKTYGAFDTLTNTIGKVNNSARRKAHDVLESINYKYGINLDQNPIRAKHFTDSLVNASFAYTPYFFVKSDIMATQWDTAKMDMGIERAIDGITHFKGKELKAGVGEIWSAMWHKPFADPARELQAQQRICSDKSAADGQAYKTNNKCMDDAVRQIVMNSQYQENPDTRQFVERIQDSKKRSQYLLDNFRKEEAKKFTDKVESKADKESFAERELWKKTHSRDDFPDLGTTVH